MPHEDVSIETGLLGPSLLARLSPSQHGRVVGAKRQSGGAYDALLQLPEHVVGEVIGGELFTQPRPSVRHAKISSLLGILTGPFQLGVQGLDEWVILDEPELHLGSAPEVLVPDLAGWRRARMPELPLEPAMTLAPDWICEVLSPSTAFKDRSKKLPIYAREGVAHTWLIDPETTSLEVFRLDGTHWKLIATHGEDQRVRIEPFDAIELELALLWKR